QDREGRDPASPCLIMGYWGVAAPTRKRLPMICSLMRSPASTLLPIILRSPQDRIQRINRENAQEAQDFVVYASFAILLASFIHIFEGLSVPGFPLRKAVGTPSVNNCCSRARARKLCVFGELKE